MKFLLTNDDGIDAPGLAALEAALAPFGEIVVAAPDRPLSGCSHRATTHEVLRVEKRSPGRFAVGGSPADCVRLALLHLAEDADWVVSGINDGGNLGVDVYLSGTVAAAREAALSGRPAMALSQYRRGKTVDWDQARRAARRVFGELAERPLAPRAFWNVNFPDWSHADHRPAPDADSAEIVFAQLDLNPLPVAYEILDEGFFFRGDYHGRRRHEGGDIDVCFTGRVAVTEIHPTNALRGD